MATLDSAISAAASALSAERLRVEVAVSNLANAESTRGPDGKAYRRRARMEPKRFVVIDARPPADEVFSSLEENLLLLFKLRGRA